MVLWSHTTSQGQAVWQLGSQWRTEAGKIAKRVGGGVGWGESKTGDLSITVTILGVSSQQLLLRNINTLTGHNEGKWIQFLHGYKRNFIHVLCKPTILWREEVENSYLSPFPVTLSYVSLFLSPKYLSTIGFALPPSPRPSVCCLVTQPGLQLPGQHSIVLGHLHYFCL